ncbi:matrixin family metalloprotease [Ralstonia pseudosolanacearum]
MSTPITLDMVMFKNNSGQITQSMIDVINKSPTLVAQLNQYNNDVTAGYKIDPATGGQWINPATGTGVKIDPIQFTTSPSVSSAAYAPTASNEYSLVFNSGASFFSGTSPDPVGFFVGYLSHEIGHYVNGASDSAAEQALLGQLSSYSLTDAQKIQAMAGLSMTAEGEGIVNNYLIYKELSAQGFTIQVPSNAQANGSTLLGALQTVDAQSSGNVDAIAACAATYNANYNVAASGVPYFKQAEQAWAPLLSGKGLITDSTVGSSDNPETTTINGAGGFTIGSGINPGSCTATSTSSYNTNSTTGTTSVDTKNLNGDGSVKNEVDTSTTKYGVIDVYASGQGASINQSNASVTLADGASATVTGNNNAISVGSNDSLTINGTLNKDTVSGTGSTVQDNGSKDYTAIQGNNDSATVTGTNSVADSAGTGDQITLTGSNDGAGVFGSGSSATDTGVGGYVALIGNNDTGSASGNGTNTWSEGSSDYLALNGNNETSTVYGDNSVTDSAGTGDKTTLAGTNDGAGVFGSGSSATDTGAGGYVALIGNSDTGSVSGSGTNTWSEGSSDYLVLNGNNETSTVYGDNSVTDSTGTGDKTTLDGANDGAGVFGSGSSAADTGAGGYVALIGNSDTGSVSGSGTNTWSEGSSDYLALNGNNETSTVYGNNSVTDSTGSGDKTTLDGTSDGAGVFGSGSSATDSGAGGYVALIGNNDTGSASGNGTNTWSEGSSDYLALNGSNETSTVYGNNSVTDSSGSGDKTTLDGANDGAGVFGSGSSATDSGAGGYIALLGNNDEGYASGVGTNTWSTGSGDSFGADAVDVVSSPAPVSAPTPAPAPPTEVAPEPTPAPAPEPIAGGYYGYDGFAGSQSTINRALGSNISSIAQYDLAHGDTAGAAAAQVGFKEAQAAQQSAGVLAQAPAVLEAAKWDSNVITWSVGDAAAGTATSFSGNMDIAEEAAVQQAFATWAQASGLTFVEVADSSQADIRVGLSEFDTANTGVVGYTTFHAAGGAMQAGAIVRVEDPTQDAMISGADGQLTYSGTQAEFEQVLLHEIGHALGLASNGDAQSVMNYELTSSNLTLDSTDIAGIQELYGTSSGPLSSSQVTTASQLVQAMASFAPPAPGAQTGLPTAANQSATSFLLTATH